MALAPPRPCSGHPKCPRLVVGGGPCPDHQRASSYDRYGPGWTVYAKQWLVRFPWCGQRMDGQLHAEHSACVRRGARVQARVVDHIRSVASGGAVLDPRNHQSLCRSCNVVKG